MATANETPRIAFAPSRALFGVPSKSIIAWSTAAWSLACMPISSSKISSFTADTAFCVPLPPIAIAAVAQLVRFVGTGAGP